MTAFNKHFFCVAHVVWKTGFHFNKEVSKWLLNNSEKTKQKYTMKTSNYFIYIWMMSYISGLLCPSIVLRPIRRLVCNIGIILFRAVCFGGIGLYVYYLIKIQIQGTKHFFPKLNGVLHLLSYMASVISITVVGIAKKKKLHLLLSKIVSFQKRCKIPIQPTLNLNKYAGFLVIVTAIIWLCKIITKFYFNKNELNPLLIILYDTSSVKITEAFFSAISGILLVIWHYCYSINESFKAIHIKKDLNKQERWTFHIENLAEVYLELTNVTEEFLLIISICLLSTIAYAAVLTFTELYQSIFVLPHNNDWSNSFVIIFVQIISTTVHVTMVSITCQMVKVEFRRTGKVIHDALGTHHSICLIKKVRK